MFLTLVSVFVFLSLVGVAAQRLLYPKIPILEVMVYPLVAVLGQAFAYLLILGFMVSIVKRVPSQDFWQAIRWNWPKNWATYLMAGVALSFALQGIAHFLPIPKELPMDHFFRTPARSVGLTSIRRNLRTSARRTVLSWIPLSRAGSPARECHAAIVLATAAGFSLIHAPQLGRAWGPVLVIFMVGLALTITRAVTKSVAAGLIMHMAYNGTLSGLLSLTTPRLPASGKAESVIRASDGLSRPPPVAERLNQ